MSGTHPHTVYFNISHYPYSFLPLLDGHMNPTHSGIAEMDSAHYPERLGAIAIINAPMALDIAWRVVQVCQWVPSKLHLLSLNSLLKSISLLIFYARSSLYKKKEAISQKENNYWELIISAVVVGIAKDPFDPPPPFVFSFEILLNAVPTPRSGWMHAPRPKCISSGEGARRRSGV